MDGIYHSIDELIKQGIDFVTEFNGEYYVSPIPVEFYEDAIWRVDKKTHEVSYMMYTEYLLTIDEKAKDVDPKVLEELLE